MKRRKKIAAMTLCLALTATGAAAAEAAEPEKELQGSLTFSMLYREPQTQHMVDLFMEEHPGVEITVRAMIDDLAYMDEGMTALATELVSGDCADVYDTTFISDAKSWGSGYFEDLNPYIEADPEFQRDDYYDNILKACESNGHLYQFPEAFYYFLCRLNKQITDQLDYEIPEVMDYKDVYGLFCKARDAGLVGEDFIVDDLDRTSAFLQMMEERVHINTSDRTADLDSEEYIRFLSAMQEMYLYRNTTIVPNGVFADEKNFSDTNCLMHIFNSDIDYAPTGLFQETETASAPVVLASSDGKIPFYRIGGYLSISASSSQKDLAWEFIKFYNEKRNYDLHDIGSPDYYKNFYYYAAMINRENTQVLAEHFLGAEPESLQKWEERNEMLNAKVFTDMQMEGLPDEFYKPCLEGELSPEEAAKAMQERINIYMNE